MLRSVKASPTSGGAFGVSRATPCSTWLRKPRLNSCVESVAPEQPARRLRVRSERATLRLLDDFAQHEADDDADEYRDGQAAVGQHVLRIAALDGDIGNEVADRVDEPDEADREHLGDERPDDRHQRD